MESMRKGRRKTCSDEWKEEEEKKEERERERDRCGHVEWGPPYTTVEEVQWGLGGNLARLVKHLPW